MKKTTLTLLLLFMIGTLAAQPGRPGGPGGQYGEQKLHVKKMGIIYGVTAAAFVAVFGLMTTNQLSDDSAAYTSNYLKPLEVMDSETEEYVYYLAEYLVENSDDIWDTLAFLDNIEFEPVTTMNDGGIQ
ncbi:MAG: hypothetical protein QF823_07275 [Candidatus Marinimicrobia bacterium]|jgi:hypothetical protein|nr:hypothetical protein [Candidatus Neomarinimicrobiota bacterium]|tara:strand:+ start:8465 stop:8851 length:387 start_codon:yes stop_codon:yes gene_type:complete